MLKKTIAFVIALFVVAGVALGVTAVLAQEAEDATAPDAFGPGQMWQWSQDGEQPDMPYGPGHMWQEDGERPDVPFGPGRGMMGGWLMDDSTLLDVVAEALDLTVDEIVAELEQGISIATLAENHGVEVGTIVNAFSERHAAYLQEAVDAGWLTEEQADWMQENMAAMIGAHVTQPWGEGFGPGAGLGGCHGYNGEAPGGGSNFGPRGRGGMHGGWGGWQQ